MNIKSQYEPQQRAVPGYKKPKYTDIGHLFP